MINDSGRMEIYFDTNRQHMTEWDQSAFNFCTRWFWQKLLPSFSIGWILFGLALIACLLIRTLLQCGEIIILHHCTIVYFRFTWLLSALIRILSGNHEEKSIFSLFYTMWHFCQKKPHQDRHKANIIIPYLHRCNTCCLNSLRKMHTINSRFYRIWVISYYHR